jgi:hypothetical protein
MSARLVVGIGEQVDDGGWTVVVALAGESVELSDGLAYDMATALRRAVDECRRRRLGRPASNGDPVRWRHDQEDPDA